MATPAAWGGWIGRATDVVDGNILARVRHETSPGAELQVQAYYDRTFRSMPGSLRGASRHLGSRRRSTAHA